MGDHDQAADYLEQVLENSWNETIPEILVFERPREFNRWIGKHNQYWLDVQVWALQEVKDIMAGGKPSTQYSPNNIPNLLALKRLFEQ